MTCWATGSGRVTMVMDCRSRWFGLEQEGFGIVFVEAAATGWPKSPDGPAVVMRRCRTV